MNVNLEPQPAVRKSFDEVLSGLREAIFLGRLVPGQRLVEADLTREYGVSRGPVREALRQLAAENVIEAVPNQSAVVRRFTVREMHELFEIRAELEALAARKAAECLKNPQVRNQFIAATEAIWSEHAGMPMSAYIEENRRFHQAIADASGSERLAALIRQMQLPLILLQIHQKLDKHSLEESVQEHRVIASALLEGDAGAAETHVREHLGRARELLDGAASTNGAAPRAGSAFL